jgi:hypothetical protein
MTPTGSFSRDSTLEIHICHISYAFGYYNIAQTIQTVHISSLVHIYMLIMARISWKQAGILLSTVRWTFLLIRSQQYYQVHYR